MRTLASLLLILLWASGVCAGDIRNTDAKAYTYTIHWEDLSPPESFEIEAGASRHFDERKATVVLQGQKDNIYVRPGEVVIIVGGVMQIESASE